MGAALGFPTLWRSLAPLVAQRVWKALGGPTCVLHRGGGVVRAVRQPVRRSTVFRDRLKQLAGLLFQAVRPWENLSITIIVSERAPCCCAEQAWTACYDELFPGHVAMSCYQLSAIRIWWTAFTEHTPSRAASWPLLAPAPKGHRCSPYAQAQAHAHHWFTVQHNLLGLGQLKQKQTAVWDSMPLCAASQSWVTHCGGSQGCDACGEGYSTTQNLSI